MNENIREDIKAYLDGELSVERAEQVREALEADPQLRMEADEMKNLSEHLKSTIQIPEVKGLDAALNRVRPKFMLPKWAAYAATCGVVIIAAVILMPKPPGQGPQFAAGTSDLAASTKSLPNSERLSEAPEAQPRAQRSPDGFSGKADQEADGSFKTESNRWNDDGIDKSKDLSAKNTSPAAPMVSQSARDVIKNGDIEVQVTDVKTASTGFAKYVQANGGYVESSNMMSNDESPSSAMTVRVPSGRFEETMAYLRSLGKVESDSTSGQDVTAQIADTSARIRVMKAEEDQLVTLLSAARKIGEILEIKDRLNQVRQEIESLESQSKSLKSLASLSTINVTFNEKPKVKEDVKKDDWLGETWINAVNALQSVWKVIVQIGAYVLAFAPLWIPAIALIWFLKARAAKPKS